MRETKQELFWEGKFGNEYISRNQSANIDAANIQLFSEIFGKLLFKPKSFIELGANIGNNLKAIKTICPNCKTIGVEINSTAAKILEESDFCDLTINETLFDIDSSQYISDISMTKGVLIHIDPKLLDKAYDILYKSSKKYILLVEYFNPTPVEIIYRGHEKKLFKRDFARDLMKRYDNLNLIDYGFKYNGDNLFPQDDLTWFLLSK